MHNWGKSLGNARYWQRVGKTYHTVHHTGYGSGVAQVSSAYASVSGLGAERSELCSTDTTGIDFFAHPVIIHTSKIVSRLLEYENKIRAYANELGFYHGIKNTLFPRAKFAKLHSEKSFHIFRSISACQIAAQSGSKPTTMNHYLHSIRMPIVYANPQLSSVFLPNPNRRIVITAQPTKANGDTRRLA